ncbi:DNA replication and repair protein RecF [Rubellimicrobium thermophilum DSM 16684]|uniref:DNA replication and repair protein RecF n=1 Tax=Rubellimicrobium thermophilum DSM 16684 TaxID=1123069 RepID=S9QXW2_9RHOB|nr:DNA replication and repair protein RecF [Rubellimicrobium thermophilum DSM 16684]
MTADVTGKGAATHLSALSLSEFRSHARARLLLDGRIVALWGANGAGKTNLLEAVSFLSPGRGLRGAGAAELARRGGSGGWRVAAILETPEGPREIETGLDPAETSRRVRLDGKAALQTDLARLLPVLWLVPAMDRLWTEGAEGRRRFLDRAAMSLFPDHAEAALAYEKALRERNRLLRDGVRDGHWYAVLEAQMAGAGTRLARNRAGTVAVLAAAQAEAETGFPAAALAVTYPGEAPPEDEAAFAEALARGRRQDMAAGRSLLGPHRADLEAVWAAKGVAARDCSTGEQKALLLSLVLANARALARRGRAPLLLLDEVAAHLDRHRRAALYDELVALRLQAFLTGTEPALFAELGGMAQYWEAAEAGGTTTLTERRPP